eukprot:11477045-Karenia_brevis.AAC.1
MEHPATPRDGSLASVWKTEEIKFFRSLPNASEILLHQCVFGAASRKDTKLFGINCNFNAALAKFNHNGRCPGIGNGHIHEPLGGRNDDGTFKTAKAK